MKKITMLVVLGMFVFTGVFSSALPAQAEVKTVGQELLDVPMPELVITTTDLGISNVGTLPTSRFYFFKEWGWGIQRVFTFNPIERAELELKNTNVKAAELLVVAEGHKGRNTNDGISLIQRAIKNYTKAQERLQVQLAKLPGNSEDPKVAEFLEKVNEQTANHLMVLRLIAGKQIKDISIVGGPGIDSIDYSAKITGGQGDDTFDEGSTASGSDELRDSGAVYVFTKGSSAAGLGIARAIENAQANIQKTIVTAMEKDKDKKKKAEDQIACAEEAVGILAAGMRIIRASDDAAGLGKVTSSTGGYVCPGRWNFNKVVNPTGEGDTPEPSGILVPIPGILAAVAIPTFMKMLSNPVGGGDTPEQMAKFQIIQQAGVAVLGQAERAIIHLNRAKEAFIKEEFGEAYGQARSAEVEAISALRVVTVTSQASWSTKTAPAPAPTEGQTPTTAPASTKTEPRPSASQGGQTLKTAPPTTPTSTPHSIQEDSLKQLPNAESGTMPIPPKESMTCTAQYDPVCGDNGKTYGNSCLAGLAKIAVKYKGECPVADQSVGTDTGTPSPDGTSTRY